MVTGCAASNRWRAGHPGTRPRWFGRAPRWSRRAPRRPTSCGRSWPSTGQALVSVFQKLTSPIALAFLTDYPTPQSAALLGEGRMRSVLPPAQLSGRQVPRRAGRPAPGGAGQREPDRAEGARGDRSWLDRADPACSTPRSPASNETWHGALAAHPKTRCSRRCRGWPPSASPR